MRFFSGDNYKNLAIVSDGRLVDVLDWYDSPKAHAIQFGLIWIYGISFGKGGKKDKPARDFFEFITYYLWDLQPDTRAGARKKRACNEVYKLWAKFQKWLETQRGN